MNEEKTLEDVDSIDVLPKVEITGETEILISMDIDGKEIFVKLGISEYLAKEILKKIGYGGIGWEKFNVV